MGIWRWRWCLFRPEPIPSMICRLIHIIGLGCQCLRCHFPWVCHEQWALNTHEVSVGVGTVRVCSTLGVYWVARPLVWTNYDCLFFYRVMQLNCPQPTIHNPQPTAHSPHRLPLARRRTAFPFFNIASLTITPGRND